MSSPEFATPTVALATVGKVRSHILPFIFILYIIAFLDRVNIGFASLKMNDSLGINPQQFGMLAGIFFLGYFLFEIPSNLLLHKFGARLWIARIMVSWGIVAALTGLAQTAVHLYVLRFLLGIAEAGFFPGIILYLTYWFRRQDRARAVALFMTAVPVCSIIGAPVSGFILDHVRWFGVDSWRWLLVLEALPALLFGLLTLKFLPSRPSEAAFLTSAEKTWLMAELEAENASKLKSEDRHSVLKSLTSWRVWQLALIYFTLIIGLYSVSFWTPQIISALVGKHSNTRVGMLLIVPHLVGLIAMIFVSRSSDRRLERKYHAVIPTMLGGLALLVVGEVPLPVGAIALLSIAVVGIYSFFGPFWSLPSQFLAGIGAASGIALINSIGNLGGFVGPYLAGFIMKRNGSTHWALGAAGVSMLLSSTMLLLLRMESSESSGSRLQ